MNVFCHTSSSHFPMKYKASITFCPQRRKAAVEFSKSKFANSLHEICHGLLIQTGLGLQFARQNLCLMLLAPIHVVNCRKDLMQQLPGLVRLQLTADIRQPMAGLERILCFLL